MHTCIFEEINVLFLKVGYTRILCPVNRTTSNLMIFVFACVFDNIWGSEFWI